MPSEGYIVSSHGGLVTGVSSSILRANLRMPKEQRCRQEVEEKTNDIDRREVDCATSGCAPVVV